MYSLFKINSEYIKNSKIGIENKYFLIKMADLFDFRKSAVLLFQQ